MFFENEDEKWFNYGIVRNLKVLRTPFVTEKDFANLNIKNPLRP